MKLFKKMVALVAVVACCFTMTVPIKAEAMTCSGGKHSPMVKSLLQRTETELGWHVYFLPPTAANETSYTPVICYTTEITEVYWVSCMCGERYIGEVHETWTEHSSVSCPEI